MANYDAFKGNRRFMKSNFSGERPPAPQDMGEPQPPLVKGALTAASIKLPQNYQDAMVQPDYLALVQNRRSRRAFAPKPLTLLQLSFLLYSTQGVQKIIGGGKPSTQRPVPSGGARHAFETYIAVRSVEGLVPGLYHYLPLVHKMELIKELENYDDALTAALNGQSWAAIAPVVLVWSCVPARSEWRYATDAAHLMCTDIGHVGQAAYLSAGALGLGGCGLSAYNQQACDALLGLDGEEEFVLYAQAVGMPKQALF